MKKKILAKFFIPLVFLLCLFGDCKKRPEEDYLEPVNVSGEDANVVENAYPPSLAIDSRGTLHLVWTDDTTGGIDNILYAVKPQGEAWSRPVRVADDARFPFITIDKNDIIHFTWQQFARLDTINHISGWVICYKYKQNNRDWSAPETLFWNLLSAQPSLTVDNEGNVHLVWESYCGDFLVTYARRDREGNWTMPTVLSFGKDLFIYTTGNLNHLFFYSRGATLHMFCSPDGNWSNPETIYTCYNNTSYCFSPFMDKEGKINLYWISTEDDKPIYHSKRDASGKWSKPIRLFSAYNLCLFLSSAKELHLVWEMGKVLFHSQTTNEEWGNPDTIKVKDFYPSIYSMRGAIDSNDNFHIVWIQYNVDYKMPKEIYYLSFKP